MSKFNSHDPYGINNRKKDDFEKGERMKKVEKAIIDSAQTLDDIKKIVSRLDEKLRS